MTAPATKTLPLALPRRSRLGRSVVRIALLLIVAGLVGWGAWRLYASLGKTVSVTPTVRVRRGDVTFTITGRGQVQGGSPEIIPAPMAGGEMRIKFLRRPGELVHAGDVVIEFDTSDQEFRLKEAQSDVAEADQQVIKATAEREAKQEEDRYSLLQAQADVRQAELEVRKNPLVSAITARQNELALQAARDRLAEIQHDLANRAASNEAAIALQQAARAKAQAQADMARRNIDLMTVRARSDGYVSIAENPGQGWFISNTGGGVPLFRVGDRAYPGMAVAEIPDLKNWQLKVAIDEVDRGHLAPGQSLDIRVIALPFRAFHGKVRNLGGTIAFWGERRFECVMTIDDPVPQLRPGMTAEVVVTTDVLKNAQWIPAQALFESDGRTFVYVSSGAGFSPHDVKLVRRSETQAVITGLADNQVVALASPEQQPKKKAAGGAGPIEAIHP